MEPCRGAGWTVHNNEVLRLYKANLDLEIIGGGMANEEVDGHLARINEIVEADDGENKRVAAEAAAHAANTQKARSYRDALNQQSINELYIIDGKGKGKEKSSFPQDLKAARYNPMPHNKTSDTVKAISGLASRAAQDEAARQQQPAAEVEV